MQKLLLTLVVLLTAVSLSFAQPERGGRQRGPDFISQLDLTAEQQAAIAEIRKAAQEKGKALRQQGTRPDRAAMKQIRETSMREVEAVLTPAQLEKLGELKANQRNRAKDDKKALRQDLKVYRDEEITPILRAARAQLDEFISTEDQATIAALRKTLKKERKGTKKEQKGADRETRKAGMEQWKNEHAAEFATLNQLIEKYAQDIERIKGNLQPQVKKWRTEQREIIAKHLPKGKQAKRKGGRKKPMTNTTEANKWPNTEVFLLMKG